MKEQKMNKILAGILAVSMTAGLVSAQDPVLSRNAVGYVKVELQKGLNLITHQFQPMTGDGARTVSDLFDLNAFPSGTILQKWDYASQRYVANETKVTFPQAAWSPGTNTFELGESVWVRIPQGAPQNVYTNIMMGEVPDVDSISVSMGGLTFVGVSFPISVHITNMASVLNYPLRSGDIVQRWNAETQNYQQEVYQTFPTPQWTPGTMEISAGQGIIIRRPTALSSAEWNQEKPYEWP
jgi:hypothetical protein